MSNPIGSFLKGVRVLDLSQYIPGPLGSLMLVDMGADVIKIEPPSGDPMRDLGPRNQAGEALFHRTLNACKQILRLDLKTPKGAADLLDLVGHADVLIEGFRPGAMQRLGFDHARLSAVNPRLIYCSISGYGATGKQVLKAGHDANYLAEAGVLDRNGDMRPVYFDPPIADLTGSLFAALAIVGALHGRHRTGQGCHIDLGLADVIMPLQMLQIADHGENATVPQRGQTYLNGGAAYYNVYETRDHRHLVVGAVEPKFWQTFSKAAGRPEWVSRQGEDLPQTNLINDVAARIAEMTLAENLECFADGDCCVSAVLDLNEALNDGTKQLSARIAHRDLVRLGSDGLLQSLFPARVNDTAPALRPAMRDYLPPTP